MQVCPLCHAQHDYHEDANGRRTWFCPDAPPDVLVMMPGVSLRRPAESVAEFHALDLTPYIFEVVVN